MMTVLNNRPPTHKTQDKNNPNQKSKQIQTPKCIVQSYATTPTQREKRNNDEITVSGEKCISTKNQKDFQTLNLIFVSKVYL
jgi:hypothetical protein